MMDISDNNLSCSIGDYKTQQLCTERRGFVFVKRAVCIVCIGTGTFFFPVTGLLVGAKSFYNSRNQGMDLSSRFRGALATAVFPLVIMGPFLFYKLSKNNTIKGMSMLSKEVDGPKTMMDYCIISIPFFSSFLVSLNLIYPSYHDDLRHLLKCGPSFFNKNKFVDYSISIIIMLFNLCGVTSEEFEDVGMSSPS
ncbi:MAG: hypothetical protein KAG53_02425 [Endozoicomonadaceae bacterium]|nr:hypothetical protein [Endozoicomonadaceae bacterium]